jgi:hypothetical protein
MDDATKRDDELEAAQEAIARAIGAASKPYKLTFAETTWAVLAVVKEMAALAAFRESLNPPTDPTAKRCNAEDDRFGACSLADGHAGMHVGYGAGMWADDPAKPSDGPTACPRCGRLFMYSDAVARAVCFDGLTAVVHERCLTNAELDARRIDRRPNVAGFATPQPRECGNTIDIPLPTRPGLAPGYQRFVCTLAAGHAGPHDDAAGAQWPNTAEPPPRLCGETLVGHDGVTYICARSLGHDGWHHEQRNQPGADPVHATWSARHFTIQSGTPDA